MTTRRQFLQAMGRAGGYSAAYLAMQALGLIPMARAAAPPFALPAGSGTGRSVVVLGAGVAGLVAAYELGRAGYAVTVLEARDRVAGRVWTVRGGDRVQQIGRPDQMCLFDDGLYMNAGAARLPTHHTTILGYARDLGVPIEVMVNVNRSAGVDAGGQIVPERQAVNDTRGRIAELLAKSVDKGALDGELTGIDKAKLRTFLTEWGALDPKGGGYIGSERSGYRTTPGGYGEAGKLMDPLTLDQIMTHGAWQAAALFEETFDQQAPMFQPVGGMDRIAHALYERVKGSVRLSTPVKGVQHTPKGVRVLLADGGAVEADWCLCAMPANQVAKLDAPFSPGKKAALKAARYVGAAKVAWEAPRFWEADGIYGGISFTDQPNGLVWYPSGKWNTDRGVLMGAYAFSFGGPAKPDDFTRMPPEQRFAISRGVIERLHPGKAALLTKPVTVSWLETPYSEGIGAAWTEAQRKTDYLELAKPEGRIYFAGEHLSYIPFWQEGAALSAQAALGLLARRVADEKVAG